MNEENQNNNSNNYYNNQYQNNDPNNNQNKYYNNQFQNNNPNSGQNNYYNNQIPPQQNNMQQGYTYGNNVMNYNIQPPFQKKAPVLGIISLVLAFITFIVSVYVPVAGVALSILIIVLCIVALVRKEEVIALPIIGIVFGVLLCGFSTLLVLADVFGSEKEESIAEKVIITDQEEDQFYEGQDVFSGRILIMKDGSALYLFNDGTYNWYQTDAVKDDNYFSGTFEVYNADAAEDFMVNDLEDYGIDSEEIDDYFQRNSGDSFYIKENLYCLVIDCNYRLVGGVETTGETDIVPYCVFSDGVSYDMANLKAGSYIVVTETKQINDED